MADEKPGAASTTGAEGGTPQQKDQKPAGEQKAGEGEGKKTAEGQQGTQQEKPGQQPPATDGGTKAPAKYALAVPDDAKRFVGARHLELVEKIARENDWTNAEAQAELDERIRLHVEETNGVIGAWETETKADKTYGGDKLPETQRLANLVIDRVRPKGHARRDSFLAFMKNSGGGVNIEVASFLADLGKLMSEDTGTGGRSGGGSEPTTESVLYDNPSSRALDNQQRS